MSELATFMLIVDFLLAMIVVGIEMNDPALIKERIEERQRPRRRRDLQ